MCVLSIAEAGTWIVKILGWVSWEPAGGGNVSCIGTILLLRSWTEVVEMVWDWGIKVLVIAEGWLFNNGPGLGFGCCDWGKAWFWIPLARIQNVNIYKN